MTTAHIAFLKRTLHKLVQKADCRYTVTVAHLKKAAKVKVSERSISRALHKQGIYFRRLREKPVLIAADIRARLAFARKYHRRPARWWSHHLDAAIDGQFFKALLTADARAVLVGKASLSCWRHFAQCMALSMCKPLHREDLSHSLAWRTRRSACWTIGVLKRTSYLCPHSCCGMRESLFLFQGHRTLANTKAISSTREVRPSLSQ